MLIKFQINEKNSVSKIKLKENFIFFFFFSFHSNIQF